MNDDHSNWKHLLFYFGLALLVCHQLDAVARHEWRLLPGLSLLDDRKALIAFVLLHVPVFVGLFWLTGHKLPAVRRRSQLGVDAFLIVHAIIHATYSDHELYEFVSPLEEILVLGGAIVGTLHASVTLLARSRG